MSQSALAIQEQPRRTLPPALQAHKFTPESCKIAHAQAAAARAAKKAGKARQPRPFAILASLASTIDMAGLISREGAECLALLEKLRERVVKAEQAGNAQSALNWLSCHETLAKTAALLAGNPVRSKRSKSVARPQDTAIDVRPTSNGSVSRLDNEDEEVYPP